LLSICRFSISAFSMGFSPFDVENKKRA